MAAGRDRPAGREDVGVMAAVEYVLHIRVHDSEVPAFEEQMEYLIDVEDALDLRFHTDRSIRGIRFDVTVDSYGRQP